MVLRAWIDATLATKMKQFLFRISMQFLCPFRCYVLRFARAAFIIIDLPT